MAMDLMSLPETPEGFNCVLTVVDLFSRFAWVQPLKSKTAREVLAAFQTILVPISRPSTLVSDIGAKFKNSLFEGYCKEAGGHTAKFLCTLSPRVRWCG
jgi:hypothetical protein